MDVAIAQITFPNDAGYSRSQCSRLRNVSILTASICNWNAQVSTHLQLCLDTIPRFFFSKKKKKIHKQYLLVWYSLHQCFTLFMFFSPLVLLCIFALVSYTSLPSQQLVAVHFVALVFYLVKERNMLSKRRSLLVLYITIFYPLWMLICKIKSF